MEPQPGSSTEHNYPSPKKKRRPSAFTVTEKEMIRNVYKYVFDLLLSNLIPGLEYPTQKDCFIKTADILGISVKSVERVMKEYKSTHQLKSPKNPGPKRSFKDKLDEFTFSAIRRKVHSFFRVKEAPTVEKVLKAVNEDPELPNFSWSTMRKIMKHLNFKFTTKTRRSVLIDKEEIILWRLRYLHKIKQYRREGRFIYYQDETWVNEGHTKSKAWVDETISTTKQAFKEGLTTGLKGPSGKGKRLIISHIGSEEGFLDGGLLCFESKTGKEDYHQEMNADCFEEWFKLILPKLKPQSILVMDNAPYHSRKVELLPTMSWTKARIQEWLTSKNLSFDATYVKATLMDIVRQNKELCLNKYVVDEMAAEHGVTVLRLPPYHCELNPIELVWAQVKGHVVMNNKTFKMAEVKSLLEEGLRKVTAQKWIDCVSHAIKEEDKMCNLDHLIDGVIDEFVINLNESSTSESSASDISDH